MRHCVAVKVEGLLEKFFSQLYPLSYLARYLLASKFSKDDENQSNCKRIADAVRIEAVIKILKMFIEAAYSKEESIV